MKVERLEAFKRKLGALPAAAKKEMRAAMEKSADEIVDLMKRSVPVDQGVLRNSIGWTFGDAPEGAVVVAKTSREAVAQAGLSITIYAGNEAAYYVRFIEFGTQKMAARPFFFPSWRLGKKRAVNRINRATRKAAKEVAAK